MAPCDAMARIRELEAQVVRLRQALEHVRASGQTGHPVSGVVISNAAFQSVLAALDKPQPKEPPYYVLSFWSPCRKYIISACVPSPGSDICIVDDDGNQWEPTGPAEDMTKLAQPQTEHHSWSNPHCQECGEDPRVVGYPGQESGNG